jgi:hypothetical protein
MESSLQKIGFLAIGLLLTGGFGLRYNIAAVFSFFTFLLGCLAALFWGIKYVDSRNRCATNSSEKAKLPVTPSPDSVVEMSPKDLRIWYEDASGDWTKRVITPIRLDQSSEGYGSSPRLHAFCHLRQGERTFLLQRIVSIRSAKTDEPMYDMMSAIESTLAAHVENPDVDAHESHQYMRTDIRPVAAELEITYDDSTGQRSRRHITVDSFAPAADGGYVIFAHCHLRDESRKFLSLQIHECVDRETGEAILHIESELEERFFATATGALHMFFTQHRATVDIALFIARIDGRLTRAERKIFHGMCQVISGDSRLSDTMIDQAIDRFPRPSERDFLIAVEKISVAREFHRKVVLRAAKLLLASDKKITEEEKRIYQVLCEAIEH